MRNGHIHCRLRHHEGGPCSQHDHALAPSRSKCASKLDACDADDQHLDHEVEPWKMIDIEPNHVVQIDEWLDSGNQVCEPVNHPRAANDQRSGATKYRLVK